MLRGLTVATVIDVGANRGQFSLMAAGLWPDARILGFEPLPACADAYRSALGQRAVLRQCALGAEKGTASMFESSADDSSSLLEPTSSQLTISGNSRVVRRTEVEVSTLDLECPDEIVEPTLLKIDVQGYELEVLKGCQRLLASAGLQYVYVELSLDELYGNQALAHEVISALGGHQFQLRAIANPYVQRGRVLQFDALFARAFSPGVLSDD